MFNIKNRKFLKRYPFMKIYKWNGKFMGYRCTYYDYIPSGWQKAFGISLMEELRTQLIKEAKEKGISFVKYCRKYFTFIDIKEKYGKLRLYASCSEECEKILEKYEYMSLCYCIECGAPARYVSGGWISYLCAGCMNKRLTRIYKGITRIRRMEYLKRHRLTEKDIPECTNYINGVSTKVDFKKEYGIDFKESWELK